jgi:glutaredoxin-like protein
MSTTSSSSAFIPESYKKQLRDTFSKGLTEDVRIVHFTQEFECGYCKECRGLLQELASTSDKIKLEVYDFVKDPDKAKEFDVDKIPATVLVARKDNDGVKNYGIRFFGTPSGYEFSTLVEDIVDVSQNKTSSLSQKTLDRLRTSVDQPLHIQVFVTLTCPYCPRAVRLAHKFALAAGQYIKADMVESAEFPQLANRYDVMSVPKTIVNDGAVSFEGALPEEHYVEHILLALHDRAKT